MQQRVSSLLNKIGFILEHLGPAQLPYQLIRSINSYYEQKDDTDIILFYRNCLPFVVTPNCAVMNLFEAFRYGANLVATDLNSASRILDYFCDGRYFYVWDLEWTKANRPYEQLADIYQNSKLKLIARSQQHFDIIQTTWGITPVGIVNDCNIKEFLGLINGK